MAFQKGDASVRKLLFRDKILICICLALTQTYAASQQGYFIVPRNYTWTEARNYCQVCYKDLVTLTAENSQHITRMIKSEHWIGLRKRFSNSTDNQTTYDSTTSTYNNTHSTTHSYEDDYSNNSTFNSTNNSTDSSSTQTGMEWTQWANGDPLSFQNWYPGWPAPKFPLPKIDCCSCSCTCPAPPKATVAPTYKPLTTTLLPSPSRMSNSPATVTRTENTTGLRSLANVTDQNGTSFTRLNYRNGLTNTTDINSVTDVSSFTDATVMSNVTNVSNVSNSADSPNQNGTTAQRSWGSTATSSASFASSASSSSSYITTSHTTGTSYWASQLPIESTCEQSPMEPPVIPEPYKNYIEDSCVVMLSFGPWIEKHCFEYLPFICYEEVFMGSVNVAKITSSNASLSWLQAPGQSDLVEYRVEIKGDKQWVYNRTNLTLDLSDLTPGTKYSVQVFPMKCDRDLKSQDASFYTIPLKVENLTVTNVTETSVSLEWTKPFGNRDFYIIHTEGYSDKKSETENFKFDGLTPGTCFTFSVYASVNASVNNTSEGSTVTNCTKPSKVTDLKVIGQTESSLTLSWERPTGNFSRFRVRACIIDNPDITKDSDNNTVEVKGLTPGSKVKISVTVQANNSEEGDSVTIESYTTAKPVSNLTLTSTSNTVTASWSYNNTSNLTFSVRITGDPLNSQNTSKQSFTFTDLKTAASYTVFVSVFSGTLESSSVSGSIFTKPSPPKNPKFMSANTSSITFQWDPPDKAGNNINYIVSISSNFWNYSSNATVTDATKYTFDDLKSGSTYNFSVYIKTATDQSDPVTCSGQTVSVQMTIGLSMLCSSPQSLLCDDRTTRDTVFVKLEAYFRGLLGNGTEWNLSKHKL